jgi:hypothetical protein
MLKEIYWGPGRETHVLLRRPRFLGHPSTTFSEHTFLPLLPGKIGFALPIEERLRTPPVLLFSLFRQPQIRVLFAKNEKNENIFFGGHTNEKI